MHKILVLPGSLRKDSLTSKLVQAFIDLAPDDVEVTVANIEPLPMYNQDLELPEPDYLIDFKNQIRPSNGILIVTPEYNRSIPPVLKNALDWASRPQALVGHGTWGEKPAAIAGASPYSLGAFGASHHLRQVLTFLNMPTMQQPEFYLSMAGEKFDENNQLVDQNTKDHIKNFWSEFLKFIDKLDR